MADDVHVHQPAGGSGGGVGVIAVVLAVVVLGIVLWFVLGGGANRQGGTTVEVPDQIQIDINAPTGGGPASPDGGTGSP